MGFYYSNAVIVEDLSFGYVLQLDDGSRVVSKFGPKPDLRLGTKVVVSWHSQFVGNTFPYHNGDYYVNNSAIELEHRWDRNSVYKRHSDRLQPGFVYEREVIDELLQVGWRVAIATAYEDEKLGVDVWVFIETSPHMWNWVPIDITSHLNLTMVLPGNKLRRNFNRGIITLKKQNNSADYISKVLSILRQLQARNIPLFSRELAMRKEMSYVPPNDHRFKTVKLSLKQDVNQNR